SMEEQTSAERRRRAAILAADGQKRAAILEAEGKRQSMILEAEGKRQSMILEAEGKRLATILESQGEAQKLRIMAVGASAMDSKALSVLSMETLKAVGDGQASKIYFPLEVTKIMDSVSQYVHSGTSIPDREVADIKDIETAVGKADDILGPIPSPDEIRSQIQELDESVKEEEKKTQSAIDEVE
ncbi:MAG: SPFH/Band 7/PHB domain protein, partial [Candidatus Methanomethylophilaceae archaeon]|nr:SPFH/Band 7/PHB domain protein [Candidatus Methanomethylophilaceae archaeon]